MVFFCKSFTLNQFYYKIVLSEFGTTKTFNIFFLCLIIELSVYPMSRWHWTVSVHVKIPCEQSFTYVEVAEVLKRKQWNTNETLMECEQLQMSKTMK